MKRFELIFTFIQLPLDYCLLVLAGLTAYSLRYAKIVTSIRPILFDLSWQKFLPMLLIVAFVWILIFAISGLYKVNPNRKLSQELVAIILACSTGFAAITIFVFFTLQKFDSRFLVLAGWLLAMFFTSLGRLCIKGVKALFYKLGIGLRQTIIIGNESIADTITQTLITESHLGFAITGHYPVFNQKIAQAIAVKKPDEIIFTDPKANEDDVLNAIDFANDNHITFKYSADLFNTISTNIAVSTIAGIPIIELRRTRLSAWGRIIKRSLDIIGSLILIVLFLPFYILASLAIILETGRPIIYENERVGQYGRKFFTLKFRSMYKELSTGIQFGESGAKALLREAELIKTNSIKNGPVYKIKNDPRVTFIGNFIRRWSLDEIPQFINVLKGEMSLVGPRPHQPREVDHYEKHHKIVLAIKPGVTGLAQISGRSDLTFEEEVKLDTFYIENWSLLLDLIILIKTPFIIFAKKGAW